MNGDENGSNNARDGDDWTHVEMADVLMRRSSPLVRPLSEDENSSLRPAENVDAVLRQSSPLIRSGRLDSPLTSPSINRSSSTGRVSTPTAAGRGGSGNGTGTGNRSSPIRLSRPRSNPRSRTPMRYESPLQADAFRIREEDEEVSPAHAAPRMEGRRITIRPMAGRAVGTTAPTTELRELRTHPEQQKSRKQGPSHRKVRRWNNDNFVNLASELASTKGRKAAEMLLLGQANASKYRSVYDPSDHRSETVSKFMEDEKLRDLRDKFFAGELKEEPARSVSHKPTPRDPVTPEEMMNRIDARLRRVVVKACENSAPASKVVDTFETFLVRAYGGKKNKTPSEAWQDILLESPTVTAYRINKDGDGEVETKAKFFFDGDSSAGGFNRLLLHGLCQFHGLKATSSTVQVTIVDRVVSSRVLTASGIISGPPKTRLSEFISQRRD